MNPKVIKAYIVVLCCFGSLFSEIVFGRPTVPDQVDLNREKIGEERVLQSNDYYYDYTYYAYTDDNLLSSGYSHLRYTEVIVNVSSTNYYYVQFFNDVYEVTIAIADDYYSSHPVEYFRSFGNYQSMIQPGIIAFTHGEECQQSSGSYTEQRSFVILNCSEKVETSSNALKTDECSVNITLTGNLYCTQVQQEFWPIIAISVNNKTTVDPEWTIEVHLQFEMLNSTTIFSGQVSCAAFHGWKPRHINHIFSNGNTERISAANMTVYIGDLDENTGYEVYCLTRSYSGVTTPLATILENVITTRTADDPDFYYGEFAYDFSDPDEFNYDDDAVLMESGYSHLIGTSLRSNRTSNTYYLINLFNTVLKATIDGEDDEFGAIYESYGSFGRYEGDGLFLFVYGDFCEFDGEEKQKRAYVRLNCDDTVAEEENVVAEVESENNCEVYLSVTGRDYCPIYGSPTEAPVASAEGQQEYWAISRILQAENTLIDSAHNLYLYIELEVEETTTVYSGYVGCAAFYNYTTVSTQDIVEYGYYTDITNRTQHVLIRNLSPETAYNVYCITMSYSGTVTAYETMIEQVLQAVTEAEGQQQYYNYQYLDDNTYIYEDIVDSSGYEHLRGVEYITNTTTTRYIGIHFFRFIKEATISPQDDDDQGSFSDEYFYGRAIAYYGNGWFGFGEGDECRLENGEYTLRSASLQLDCTTATTTSLVIEREVDNDCTISVTLSGRDYCPRFNDVVYYPADDDDDVGTAEPTTSLTASPTPRPSVQQQSTDKPVAVTTDMPLSLTPTTTTTSRPSQQTQLTPSAAPTVSTTRMPTASVEVPYWNISKLSVGEVNSKTQVEVEVFLFASSNSSKLNSGFVYCNAFMLSKLPQSAADITKGQFLAAIIQSTRVRVTITGLAAATRYAIYCTTTTSTASSSTLSFARSLATAVQTTTLCCKTISITLSSSAFFESSSYASGLSIAYDYAPSTTVTVKLSSITVEPAEDGASSVATTMYPVTVELTPSVSSGSAYLLTGSAGSYIVNATLHGPSAAEYSISFTKGSTFTVVTAGTPLPPPTLESAVFSDDGSYVIVTLSVASDRGGYINSFPCATLFNFTDSAIASCSWSDDATISISPAVAIHEEGALMVDSNIAIAITNTVRAKCNSVGNSPACSSWTTMTPGQTVEVAAPASPTTPTVVMSTAAVIGGCNAMTIDFSASSGDAGRAWDSVLFEVTSSEGDSVATVLESVLNGNYSISPPTVIHRNNLVRGAVYSIQLTLCNFLHACSSTYATVEVLNSTAALPLVSIVGPQQISLKRSAVLQVYSDAYVQDCDGKSVRSGLKYQWLLSIISAESTTPTAFTSASQDPSQFKLTSNTLTINTNYLLSLQVSSRNSEYTATTGVSVTVLPSAIIALISGGANKQYQAGQYFTVDASRSFDEDASALTDADNEDLFFAWSCTQMSPIFSEICPLVMIPSSYGADHINVTSRNTAIGTTSLVYVRVYDATRTATAYVDVTISESPTSTINIDASVASLSAVNPAEKFLISGSLKVHTSCTAEWSVDDTETVNFEDAAVTTLTQSISPGAFVDFNLLLSENVLPSHTTLTFTMTCGDASSGLTITTNAPPAPGYYTVLPPTGSELVDKFTFSATKWQDRDLPLSYQFGFLTSDNTLLIIQSKSVVSYVAANLPAGSANDNYRLTGQMTVFDAYGATASASVTVRVLSLPSEEEKIASVQDLVSAASSEDIGATKQTIAVATTVLNTVNCTMSLNCTSLHRHACSTTSFTCGACLTNYIGDNGDANSLCIGASAATATTTTQACSSANTACASEVQECDTTTGKCVYVEKECVSVDCNGHGSCVHVSVHTGETVTDCRWDNSDCTALCECSTGYDGISCEVSAAELETKQTVRAQLATALLNLTTAEDVDINAIKSWTNSLQTIARNTYELSSTAVQESNRVAGTILNQAKELKTTSYESFNGLLIAIDATTSYQVYEENRRRRRLTSPATATATTTESVQESETTIAKSTLDIVSGYSQLVASSIVLGEDAAASVFDNFRSLTAVNSISGGVQTANISLTLPTTDVEDATGVSSTALTLVPDISGSNLRSTVTASAVQTSLKLYGSNAVVTQKSNPLHVEIQNQLTQKLDSSIQRIEFMIQHTTAVTDYLTYKHKYNITTQCANNILSTHSYTCPLSSHTVNHQCNGTAGSIVSYCPVPQPSCVSLNVSTGALSAVESCTVTNYTATATTCSCTLTSVAARRRRLSATDTIKSVLNENGAADMATITIFTATELTGAFSYADDLNSAAALRKVLIVILLFSAVWGVGILLFIYIYFEEWITRHVSGTASESVLNKDTQLTSAEQKIKQTLYSYIDFIVPVVYTDKPWYIRMVEEVVRHHKYLYAFASRHVNSSKKAKYITVAQGVTVQTSLMFSLAWLYDLQGPDDDGSCSKHNTQSACLSRTSFMDSKQTYCSWDSVNGGCSYQEPQFTIQIMLYMIVLTSLISTILNYPLDYLFYILYCPTHDKTEPSIFEKNNPSLLNEEKRKSRKVTVKDIKSSSTSMKSENEVSVSGKSIKLENLQENEEVSTVVVNRSVPDTIIKVHEEATAQLELLKSRTAAIQNARIALRDNSVCDYPKAASSLRLPESSPRHGAKKDTAYSYSHAVVATVPDPPADDFNSDAKMIELNTEVIQQRLLLVESDIDVTEYDVQWGIEKKAETHTIAASESVTPGALEDITKLSYYRINPDVLRTIRTNVDAINKTASKLQSEIQFYTDKLAGLEILQQFVIDLLGRKTVAAQIFASKFDSDFDSTALTTKYHQYLAVFLLVGLNWFFCYYSLLRGYVKGYAWQKSFMSACITQFVMEIIISESIECYWLNVLVPSLARIEVREVHAKLKNVIDDIFEVRDLQEVLRSNDTVKQKQLVLDNGHILNAPEYLFVSNKLATTFPQLLESHIVKSYMTYYPGEISKTWHTTDRSPRIYNMYLQYMNGSQGVAWYARYLAIAAVYFYSTVQVLGLLPQMYQILIIRVLQPVLSSAIALLWYYVLSTQYSLIAASIACGLFAIYLYRSYSVYYVSRHRRVKPEHSGNSSGGNGSSRNTATTTTTNRVEISADSRIPKHPPAIQKQQQLQHQQQVTASARSKLQTNGSSTINNTTLKSIAENNEVEYLTTVVGDYGRPSLRAFNDDSDGEEQVGDIEMARHQMNRNKSLTTTATAASNKGAVSQSTHTAGTDNRSSHQAAAPAQQQKQPPQVIAELNSNELEDVEDL